MIQFYVLKVPKRVEIFLFGLFVSHLNANTSICQLATMLLKYSYPSNGEISFIFRCEGDY